MASTPITIHLTKWERVALYNYFNTLTPQNGHDLSWENMVAIRDVRRALAARKLKDVDPDDEFTLPIEMDLRDAKWLHDKAHGRGHFGNLDGLVDAIEKLDAALVAADAEGKKKD